MTTNEVKKALYKQKPTAHVQKIKAGVAEFKTELENGYVVTFAVPLEDMGLSELSASMEAQLLIRWMIFAEPNKYPKTKSIEKILKDNGLCFRHLEMYLAGKGYVVLTDAQYENMEIIDEDGETP